MKNTFERDLPSGYAERMHINANSKKTGIIFNLVAIVVTIAIVGLAIMTVVLNEARFGNGVDEPMRLPALLIFAACLVAYIVLHELVHGAVYKLMTGEKLTFGMSLTCAFCGLPKVYTYRKTALLALLAPFTVFTVVLLPICAWMYIVHPYYYLISSFLLGLHIGGCSGDLYMTGILLFKYKSKDTLIRDTGPEQFIYGKEEEGES